MNLKELDYLDVCSLLDVMQNYINELRCKHYREPEIHIAIPQFIQRKIIDYLISVYGPVLHICDSSGLMSKYQGCNIVIGYDIENIVVYDRHCDLNPNLKYIIELKSFIR